MISFDLAFSPCPNDTFIFHAMLNRLVDTKELSFTPHFHDVEELNQKAFSNVFHITKLSFFAWLKLKKYYSLLDSGSALGYGCGPLLIGKKSDIPPDDAKIAIPGDHTTAHLLLKLFRPQFKNVCITRFDTILQGVQNGLYDAGLIIHESRFVYEDYNLKKIVDLGEWWEEETGSPIPLGCICIRNDEHSLKYFETIQSIIKQSVHYGFQNKNASRAFIKEHSQELDDTVIENHINLYVNDFTLSLGENGRKAIETLEEMATCRNIL